MNEASSIEWLEQHFRRISAVSGAAGVLGWDQAVMMPAGGAEARAEQLAALSTIRHDLLRDPRLEPALERVQRAAGSLDPWRAANLREMQIDRIRATAVPVELVDASARARAAAEMTWREARGADDFGAVAPKLERSLALEREVAQATGDALGLSAYDSMLDHHDPGLRDSDVVLLFDALARSIPDLLDEALERQASGPEPIPIEGPFPIETQRAVCEQLMRAWGFDFEHGRLDTSAHPFTGGVPDDVRLTTRFDPASFLSGMLGVVHETGHALYERGLPAEWRHQPVGQALGMTVHESQSLLVEMQVCRSSEFFAYAAPLLRQAYGRSGPAWEPRNLTRHCQRVARGLIRVDADELSYPLHVIVRHRLERQLVAGSLPVRELPGAWRDAMREIVGIEPPDDRNGCMQDIHWYCGAWGYFPTYTLGALLAAQLFASAERALPGVRADIARGEFAPLVGWLRQHVHGAGRVGPRTELVERVTGAPLSTRAFEEHVRRRYLEGD